jgi:caffeoyl-CoA O-methyltransferase
MEFISEDLDLYCCGHTTAEPELLQRLNRHTHANVLQPRMLSGHFQGRFLSLLSKIKQPKNILEIGTYVGYSALCLAEGLQKDGHLYSIDPNEEILEIAQKFIDESNYKNQITLINGQAATVISALDCKFDMVFIDADKKSYLAYFEQIKEKLNPNAVVLFDNVLWSGKVVDLQANDRETTFLRQLNEAVQKDVNFENILLPIRDGLLMARRI